jgi:molybdenum cofactor cytidylyltransferase
MDAANNFEIRRIGAVVLAAGVSSRLKQPKQLVEFRGKTLLRRAVETALEAAFDPVLVVLGANFERTRAEIEDLPVEIVFNEVWEDGLSSSIKTGIEFLRDKHASVKATLVMLADQPFITASHLNLLRQKYLARSDNPIVAAGYDGAVGVPAIFSASVFDDLRSLAGDEGAKRVIKKYGALVRTINLPEAAIDIDTPADLEKLRA